MRLITLFTGAILFFTAWPCCHVTVFPCDLVAMLQDEEPEVNTLNVDYEYYNDCVWPLLAHRIPKFENSKVSSWMTMLSLLDKVFIILHVVIKFLLKIWKMCWNTYSSSPLKGFQFALNGELSLPYPCIPRIPSSLSLLTPSVHPPLPPSTDALLDFPPPP